MSSRRGGNVGGGGGGVAMIPTGSRKMVDSLKEIVKNHPDSEIYAALKECNMDPNEAVSRLLSQDPFHEVKSKRDKRKENKDAPESRPHGASSYGRGSKGSADRYAGRGGSDFALHGKSTSAYKENGFSTTKSTRITGSVTTRRLPTINDAVDTEKKKLADDVSPTPQYSSGHQPAWVGVPGKMSMADIVKMGKPHSKATNGSSNESWPQANVASHSFSQRSSGGPLDENWHHSQDDQTSPAQQHDDWPLIEQPSAAARNYSVPDPPTSQLHPNSSTMEFNRTSEHQPQFDEVPEAQFNDTDNVNSAGDSPMVSDSLHDRKFVDDNSGGADNDLDRYQPSLNHAFDGTEVEDADASVSLVAANMQQISIQEEEQVASPERDGPSVVIPEHLQVQAADCLNLSFGSFGSGISATPSGDLASAPVEAHVEDISVDADAPPDGHLTNVSSEYYGDEDLRNATGDILFHRTEAVSENYEQPTDSQPDSLKVEYPEAAAAQSNQYSFPSSKPADYTYENSQSPNVAFSQSQPSSHTKNNASFTNAMGYSSSLPSNLLTANVHAGRESEHPYSPFSSQAMPPKYNNSVSISGGSSISMPEQALKAIGLSSTHLTQQSLNGSNIATGPAIHQHLALHPYSQQTLPVGPFTNIISYPYMPQSYTYMPPGFQQPPFAAGNSSYQQSLAALLPQYKNSVSVSSLPPPAAGVASGYGGAFGNSGGTVHGSFPLHPSAAPSTSLGIDDGLSSRYKDINHLMSLQQGDNSGMWVHGHSSRTMSAPPTNPYYNIQGHNQPPGGGFRQVPQQSSQNHASLGYPNFYHSQAGISLDHHHHHPQQQQHLRDGSLAGAQVQQPKPSSQQLWQNGY
ncbi:unnamed protein product [Cuscuta campestris]|uniref:GBF-interacting protein 1 N-terminal domain-containing protein n=1 Tax=Cuscuta campestris TaxID=132261 RepID=A0A484LZ69_9ASTE|nr:unnamed protein product [Cuscuta campestris]